MKLRSPFSKAVCQVAGLLILAVSLGPAFAAAQQVPSCCDEYGVAPIYVECSTRSPYCSQHITVVPECPPPGANEYPDVSGLQGYESCCGTNYLNWFLGDYCTLAGPAAQATPIRGIQYHEELAYVHDCRGKYTLTEFAVFDGISPHSPGIEAKSLSNTSRERKPGIVSESALDVRSVGATGDPRATTHE